MVDAGSSRNCAAGANDDKMNDERAGGPYPANEAPVHSPDSAPMVTTRSRMTGDAEMRFCANWRSNS